MKKIAAILLIMLFAGYSHASIISYDQFSTTTQISELNTAMNRIYTNYNGNITTDNISQGAITSFDLGSACNPLVREAEIIGEYVYTGLTLPSAVAPYATSTITAGTAYVINDADATLHRVVKGSTVIGTYLSASKDNWVYLDYAGSYSVITVAVGAAQPTTPDNTIVLGYITTGAVNIVTAVETARQITPPALRQYTDYRQGMRVSYDTAVTVVVTPGNIELGSAAGAGVRRNTTNTSVAWADLDAGAEAGSTFYYVWAYPNPANATNASFKISVSAAAPTGINNYKLVGWFWNDESSDISRDSVGCYKGDGSGMPNVMYRAEETIVTNVSTTATGLMQGRFYTSGGPVEIVFTSATSSSLADGIVYTALSCDNIALPGSMSAARAQNSTLNPSTNNVSTWSGIMGAGTHQVKVMWWVDTANTVYSFSRNLSVKEL